MAVRMQTSLTAERGSLIEAQILEVLLELVNGSRRPTIPISLVTAALIERYGAEYDRPGWIGSIVRRKLNLETYKSHGVYVIPSAQRQKIALLSARYGIDAETRLPTNSAVDMGRSGTA